MPVTKITLSTAMRARDVSRPRAEDLAEAAERANAHPDSRGPATAESTESAEGRAADGTATAAPAVGPVMPTPPVAPSRRQRRRTR